MCPCVGVFGFVVSLGDFVVDFVVDFLFFFRCFFILSMGVCVSEEEVDDEGIGCADGEEREKKRSEIKNYYNNV